MAQTATKGLRVLVAEDNPVNREVVVFFLEDLGHAVTAAENGEQALAQLKAGHFDVVIMDLEMPGMDGFEATRRIRSGECGQAVRDVPIAALTAHNLAEYRRRSLELGMNVFLAKPVDFDELSDALDMLTTPTGLALGAVINMRKAMENLRGKTGLFQKLCATFLSDLAIRREALRRGFGDNDLDFVALHAHSLKSSAGLLGAESTQAAALKLEHEARDHHADAAKTALCDLERELDLLANALNGHLNRA